MKIWQSREMKVKIWQSNEKKKNESIIKEATEYNYDNQKLQDFIDTVAKFRNDYELETIITTLEMKMKTKIGQEGLLFKEGEEPKLWKEIIEANKSGKADPFESLISSADTLLSNDNNAQKNRFEEQLLSALKLVIKDLRSYIVELSSKEKRSDDNVFLTHSIKRFDERLSRALTVASGIITAKAASKEESEEKQVSTFGGGKGK